MLNFSKRTSLVELGYQFQIDSKKLFNIVNKLLGGKTSNSLPTSKSDKQLAEEFATYLLNKIGKIKERFTNIEPYQPSRLDTPQLSKFAPATASRLGQIIKKMPSKTCQLDQVPTSKLREILEGCLPADHTHG